MKNFKKITILILCICMAVSITACGNKENPIEQFFHSEKWNEISESIDLSFLEDLDAESLFDFISKLFSKKSTTSKQSSIENVDEDLIPKYEHYDAKQFYSDADKLSELVKQGKKEDALGAYDALRKEINYITSLDTVIYIMYQEDITNEYNKQEYEYTDALMTDCTDRFMTIAHEMANSSFADEFKAHLEDDMLFEDMKNYVEMTAEEKELSEKENSLENRYYDLSSDLSKYTYTCNGTTYSLADFYDNEAVAKMGMDYYEIYAGCMKEFNASVGDIFLQLVKIRDRIAELNGYDNYADYADKKIYNRDYTDYDLKALKNAVKAAGSIGAYYYRYLYYMIPYYSEDATGIVKDVKKILNGISEPVDEAVDNLSSNKLYSIGSEEKRSDAGFTTVVDFYGITPFIFMKTSDSAYSVASVIHECGHFAHYNFMQPDIFAAESYDICEIHSSGLEVLASAHYGTVFEEEDVKTLAAYTLADMESCIVSGCKYDEWQRYVYSHPEATLDEYNQKYKELLFSYGEEYSAGQEYEWAFVSHNFDAPMYYISYAVSSFVALQLWQKAQENYDEAVAAWEGILKSEPGDLYKDTIQTAGFVFFDNKDTVTSVLKEVDNLIVEYFNDLSKNSGSGSPFDIYGGY